MVDIPKLVKGVAASKTLYGLAGLLGINLAASPALDIRLWINGQIFDLGNISPVLSVALAALAVYGRLVAQGPIVAPKPDDPATPPADAPKGFPRA